MNSLVDQVRPQIEQLCRKYKLRRLDLIGSATRDDFEPERSDLDFVVEFIDLQVADGFDRYFGLLVDLEDLFQRKIDLISYQAIRNPYFKQVVDRTRVPLYAA